MANPSIQETSSSTRKLCSSCQGFDIYLFSSLPDETLVLAVGEVAEAAAAGCNFCKFMHEAAKGQFTELRWKNTGELNKHYWIHVACLGWDSRPGEPRYNFGLTLTLTNFDTRVLGMMSLRLRLPSTMRSASVQM